MTKRDKWISRIYWTLAVPVAYALTLAINNLFGVS